MRRVKSGSAVWRQAGVGSTDIAAVMNCAAKSDETVLMCWASIVQKRDLKEINRMRKERLAQGSKDWLDWRGKGMGGSEVACVVGANPYRDSKADRVWERKTGQRAEVSDNPAMAHGRKNEPDARRIYEQVCGWTAEDVCVIHDEMDFVRCSLDGLRNDDKVVLEIKCPGEKNHQKYLDIAQIDDAFERQSAYAQVFPYYRYQVLYQLAITGADMAHFVSYRPDWHDASERFVMMTLYPEPDEQAHLLERVREFWGFVERREPPPTNWLEPCWRMPTTLQLPESGLTSS